MLGWILVFALLMLGGTISALHVGIGLALVLSTVFGLLLVVSALTLILRGRV